MKILVYSHKSKLFFTTFYVIVTESFVLYFKILKLFIIYNVERITVYMDLAELEVLLNFTLIGVNLALNLWQEITVTYNGNLVFLE